MPLLFGVIGLVLIICAVNNTLGSNSGNLGLGDLLKRDFTGSNNFLLWIMAIFIAGAFGYVPKFKPVAYGFLALVFVGILLSNSKSGNDAFTNLINAVKGAGSSGLGDIGQTGFGPVGSGGTSSNASFMGASFQQISDFVSNFGNSNSGAPDLFASSDLTSI